MKEITYAVNNTETVCWRLRAADYLALCKPKKVHITGISGKEPQKEALQNHVF